MMRVTHTLKGSAGTVGLTEVVDLAHKLEGALAAVRSGQRPWSAQFADAVVEIADGIRAYVDAFGDSLRAPGLASRVHEMLAPWSEGRRAVTPTPLTVPVPVQDEPSEDRSSQSRSIFLAADLTSDGVVADDGDATTT